MNKVFLSGTVESGPKLRLETGKPDQATFQLKAWHRAEDGQWRREAYTICCQDKRAYWAMVNIEAGQRIAVEGTLLGAGQVKIAALEIEYTFGRKRTNVQAEDTQCGTKQGMRDDDADEGCEKEEPMETTEQAKELGWAQTEAQTPALGKAQSNDGIDPRQLKWYDVGKKYGRTEASRARSAQGWNAAPGDNDGDKDGRFSRMGKKLLSMVLALVMALGMAVCGGAEDAKPKGERTEGVQEELYTLWGIPWGSTEEVVRQVVREKTGLELECKEYPKHLTLSTPIFKEMQLYGIPVHSLALGLDENGFQYAQMTLSSYRYNSKNALVQDTAAFLENIGGILYQRIGFPLNGSLLVGKETKFYKFPFTAQGRFDIPLMNQILDENDSVTMYITWSNVKLEVGTYYINGKHYTSNSLWFNNEPVEFVRRDDLPPYPKKQFDECIYIEL